MLNRGTKLGTYEITSHIGSGGMGEVYQAHDSKLGRDVAIKVLPGQLARDPERLARFQREAKLLASLNHPNIATIHGLEESGGTHYLVMELVPGETLRQRMARGGRIPLGEALTIARQIAEALEAAHGSEKGIIHRDLKPANVKITPEGRVKVLDFGLAKAFAGHETADDCSDAPTLSALPTMPGAIMGTPAYMSPEQARGSDTDRRSDIWAFGVVLYEMLTGEQFCQGATVSDTLVAVLQREPDWSALPPDTPPPVRRLLRRCLEKDLKRRLQHMGDARLEMDEPPEPAIVKGPEGSPARRRGLALAVALLSVAAGGLGAWLLLRNPVAPAEVLRFRVRPPSDEYISLTSPLALSPDGENLVYGVGGSANSDRLFLHSLQGFDARALPGTENARHPFFEPEGRSIGFESSGGLRQLSLAGGAPSPLVASTPSTMGASWARSGDVVYGVQWGQPLRIARFGDAESTQLTRLDTAAGEAGHVWPRILPGDRAVLFTVWTAAPSWDEALLAVADIETGEHKIVLRGGASGRYLPSGHLVFWRGDALMAAPFDPDALEVTGEPVKVVEGVRFRAQNGGADFTLSETGTLAYVPGGLDFFNQGLLVDRSGRELLQLDRTTIADPAFSRDGRRLALTMLKGGAMQIGVYDLSRELLTPLTIAGDNLRPAWMPDGQRITYLSNTAGPYNHYSRDADGGGAPEAVFPEPHDSCCHGSAWSPDGQHLLFGKSQEQTGLDIWIVSPGSGDSPRPLVHDPGSQSRPAFSPDGRFIAYESDESGTLEVYIRPFPGVDRGRQRVSESGGRSPVWSAGGKEILYARQEGLFRVSVAPGRDISSLTLGRSVELFPMTGIGRFDIAADGRTFAIVRLPVETFTKEIHVVVNWFEELKRLVPAGK